MGNSTGNTSKKPTKIGQNDKRKRDAEICGNRKEKATRENMTVQLEGRNQKVLAKKKDIKDISTKNKTIQTKGNFPKQRKKILSAVGSG